MGEGNVRSKILQAPEGPAELAEPPSLSERKWVESLLCIIPVAEQLCAQGTGGSASPAQWVAAPG